MDTSPFQALKLSLMDVIDLSKDALHVHFGLAIMLIAALLLKKPLGSVLPWAAVLAAALAGEAWDAFDDLNSGGAWRWSAAVHDLVNTLFWPTVLLLLARTRFAARAGFRRQ